MKHFYLTIISFLLIATFSYGQKGHSCASSRVKAAKYTQYPIYKTKQALVDQQARLNYLKPQPLKSTQNSPVYTIPVVVHVVHEEGTALGTAENISDAQIQAGISHLNDAFRNIGYYNPATGADVEVEFCLASLDENGLSTTGITRTANTHFSNFYSSSNLNLEEDTLKRDIATQWDPTQYCNIWLVKEICFFDDVGGFCGTVGYAYTADFHGAPWDGIVNLASLFGSSEDNSKTHIHEIGHYLNLQHTFEGGCTNDDCTIDGDQVCDTPPDGTDLDGDCFLIENSCTTDEDDTSTNNPFRPIALGGLGDQNDMAENYMDYSYDQCMDRFTEGQKTRMRSALSGARASLLSSNGCNTTAIPEISFNVEQLTVTEKTTVATSACTGYTDYDVTMNITTAPSQDAIVNLSFTGNASLGEDYEILNNITSLLFSPTGNTQETFTIRIWDDSKLESTEDIIMNYSISGSSDAIKGQNKQTSTLTISDNEQAPSDGSNKQIIFTEDFSNGIPADWNNWFYLGPSINIWKSGNAGIFPNSAYISTDDGTTIGDDPNTEVAISLISPIIDATSITKTITLEFDLNIGGTTDEDFLLIAYENDNDFIEGNSIITTSGKYTTEVPIEMLNTEFTIEFAWINNGDGAIAGSVAEIDNIEVYIKGEATTVESDITTQTTHLSPNSSTYIFSSNSNEIIAKIDNLTAWDYGCTTIEIDRIGTSATEYNNGVLTAYPTDKTVKITPEFNNLSGSYELTLYYTEEEINGWEAASGSIKENILLFKTTDPISQESGNIEYGAQNENGAFNTDNFFVKARFNTGFSGFAALATTITTLPVELTNLEGSLDESQYTINWSTIDEQNIQSYQIVHSTDGANFEVIHTASANSSQSAHYTFSHEAEIGDNYYKIIVIDNEGTTTNIGQTLYNNYKPLDYITISPNPAVSDFITINISNLIEKYESLFITNINGKLLIEEVINNQSTIVDISQLPSGIYFIRINDSVKKLIVL